MAKKALNPTETRGRTKETKQVKASSEEALPVYKEFQDTTLKTITFSKFRIDATVKFTETLLHNFFNKAMVNGYHFAYKGLHLSVDNIDSSKAKKKIFLFTAIELKVPVNFDKEKIIKDLKRSSERVCGVRTVIDIVFDEIFEDIGL